MCEIVCVCFINACLNVETHTGGVCSVRVVLQHPGQAEVRHLTHQVAVDQDVAGSQVSVDVAQVRQVGHTGRDAAQQAHQLDDGELAIVSLQGGRKEKGKKLGRRKQSQRARARERERFMWRLKTHDGIGAGKMRRVIIEKILIKIEERVKIRE